MGLFTTNSRGFVVFAHVEVVFVSMTGKTIRTRFVTEAARQKWGEGPHIWRRVTDDVEHRDPEDLGQMLYGASDRQKGPVGQIRFPTVLPEGTL
jgi:hypothetical protein